MMRRHVGGDAAALRRGGMILMQVLTAALCLAGTGVGCDSGDDGGNGGVPGGGAPGEAMAQVLAIAPPGAAGVVHVGAWGRTAAMLEKNVGMLKGTPADQPLRTVLPFMKKISSADVFLVPGPGSGEPVAVFALRGKFGPDDLAGVLRVVSPGHAKLDKPGNGRYVFSAAEGPPPLVMIVGDEATDAPAGVVLIGLKSTLTAELAAGLGRGDNTALERLLSDVDTAADIWGGMLPADAQKDLPREISGSINLTGTDSLKLTLVCRSEEMAQQMEAIAGSKFLAKVLTASRDGKTVRVVGKASMTEILGALIEMWKDMLRWAEQLWNNAGKGAGKGADPGDL